MTNSESLDAESATAPTTKPESDALNMSAGAEMLIARMKTNPEDFKYSGRFYRVVEAMNAPHGQGWVSARDQEALRRAYSEHIQEAEFSEWVYNEIFNPKEPEPVQNLYAQALGKSMMQTKNTLAAQSLNGLFGSAAIQPGMAVGAGGIAATTHTTGLFDSVKNKLGI